MYVCVCANDTNEISNKINITKHTLTLMTYLKCIYFWKMNEYAKYKIHIYIQHLRCYISFHIVVVAAAETAISSQYIVKIPTFIIIILMIEVKIKHIEP